MNCIKVLCVALLGSHQVVNGEHTPHFPRVSSFFTQW